MTWHVIPKSDAWKQVTLEHVARLEQRLWLRCDACGHSVITAPKTFSDLHRIDTSTPLLSIGIRLKCSVCGERKAHCWPEPYGIGQRGL